MGDKALLRKTGHFIMLTILMSALSGCDEVDKYIATVVAKIESRKSSDQNKEIAALKSEIAALRQSSLELRGVLDGLKFSQDILRLGLDSTWDSAVTVTEGGSYGIARTSHGPVIVSMDRLEPYLDGYKVTLNIGNPTAMLFNDASIEVGWGLPWSTKNVSYEQIGKSQKKKKFNVLKSFSSGSYTLVEVALTPAKAEEVKELSVSVAWNKIMMRKPTQ